MRSGRKNRPGLGTTPLLNLSPMTEYRALYTICDTASPLHANHPVGTAKFWGFKLVPPSEPPAQTVIEPVGTRADVGGGYTVPLIELTIILLVFILGDVKLLNDAIEFNDTIVLSACRFVVYIVGDDTLVAWMFIVDILGDVTRLSACIVDVVMKFILAVIELNWKHPMLLAVVVRLDKKMVDTAAALTTLVLRVFVLKIGAWTVSARIRAVLMKLVLRNPVLIGSKELLMMPPFAILIPPFTLIVDAFRVEGMPAIG